MKQRGRVSEAALEVAELAKDIGRPPPPDNLTPAQAAVWTSIVDCEAQGWFKPTQFGMLANYCRLHIRCDELAVAIGQSDDALTKFLRCSHELTSIARSLRLTHQSRYYPETAGKKSSATGPRPWDTKAAG